MLVYYFQTNTSLHTIYCSTIPFLKDHLYQLTAFKIHLDVPITLKCINIKFPTIPSLKTKISSKIHS